MESEEILGPQFSVHWSTYSPIPRSDFLSPKDISIFVMIKFYPLVSMRFTPFGKGGNLYEDRGSRLLRDQGIVRTEHSNASDLFVTNRYPLSRRFLYKRKLLKGLSKPILVWTHEPRYCTIFKNHLNRNWILPPIYIMNVYTRDLYIDNFSFYSWAIKSSLKPIDVKNCPDVSQKRIAAIVTYIPEPEKKTLLKEGIELDLTALRQQLALDGHKRGLVDIYGRGWPEMISKEVSRDNRWHDRKNEILKAYHFNICIENTNFDYYCTEKIWDSIRGGCLPIYYGIHNRIYDDFPRDSFIDIAKFNCYDELFNYIVAMDKHEYCDRMNKCIEAYNNFAENDTFEAHYDRAIMSTAERIKAIISD